MEAVYEQVFCLIVFAITGIVISIIFDMFRILRRSFKTPDFITYIQDILFWIIAGIIMLFAIFKFNNGQIRSYIFIGTALGIIVYMLTLSKYFIKYSVSIIKVIKKIVYFLISFIWKIAKIICKPINKMILQIMMKLKSNIQLLTKNNKKNRKNKTNLEEKEGIS